MFGKITSQSIGNMFRNVKNHATQGYHKTKDFLNKVDHGVSIAKRVYSQIAPILDNHLYLVIKTSTTSP
jgi:translation initiation factor 2B subunit (eIF-2B alpha/beta/delta family)